MPTRQRRRSRESSDSPSVRYSPSGSCRCEEPGKGRGREDLRPPGTTSRSCGWPRSGRPSGGRPRRPARGVAAAQQISTATTAIIQRRPASARAPGKAPLGRGSPRSGIRADRRRRPARPPPPGTKAASERRGRRARRRRRAPSGRRRRAARQRVERDARRGSRARAPAATASFSGLRSGSGDASRRPAGRTAGSAAPRAPGPRRTGRARTARRVRVLFQAPRRGDHGEGSAVERREDPHRPAAEDRASPT